MQRQKMPAIGHNPRMRIVNDGVLCLRAAILAVLCTLVLAANAYADEPTAPVTPPEAGETQGQGPVEGQNQGSEGTAEGPGGTAQGEGEGEQTEGGTVVSGGETVEPPPVIKEEVPEPSPPVTEAKSEPVVVVAEQVPQETAKDGLIAGGEEALEPDSAQSTHVLAADSGTVQAAKATGGDEAAQESQVIIAGPLSLPPSAPMAGATEAQASTTPPLAGSAKRSALTAAQRAGSLSCELSALGGRTTDNCTVGWLGGKRYVESSTVSFSPAAGSLAAAATGGVPPDGGHGGAAVGNTPAGPSPGPAPSGAAGAAVGGGGGGGAAPSAYLSLAGLLLLAAPRALRRLRLSSQPWLTACFVLIPERPG
jgi:hypothetical protein